MRATPQRLIIYKALMDYNGHPTTDEIIEITKKAYPSISPGTVYRTLEYFVQNNLIKRVKSEQDIMRYDAVIKPHHHLYCYESEEIEDYFDDKLDTLLNDYFSKRKIRDFDIEDIRLQIIGKFTGKEKNSL